MVAVSGGRGLAVTTRTATPAKIAGAVIVYLISFVSVAAGLMLIGTVIRDVTRPARVARREARHMQAEWRALSDRYHAR